jgi:zinc/manganese transport system ATP-binding protein
MKGIVGVLRPMSGEVLRSPGVRVAYLPQQGELDRSFPARVIRSRFHGALAAAGALGRHRREDGEAVARALSAVGLEGFEKRGLDTLSGGQLQRRCSRACWCRDADLILLDEPFNAIDAKTVGDLVALIKRWHARSAR